MLGEIEKRVPQVGTKLEIKRAGIEMESPTKTAFKYLGGGSQTISLTYIGAPLLGDIAGKYTLFHWAAFIIIFLLGLALTLIGEDA